MRALNKRLTYANVMSSIAVFLVLGGAAFAATKVGNKSVGPNQLKANAVTTKKLKKKSVTNAKLAAGAVNFAKIAAGTNLIAAATGGPVAANVEGPASIPLSGPLSFTPKAGVVDFVHVEVRGSLTRVSGKKSTCQVVVQPLINGQLFEVSSGYLFVESEDDEPSNFLPVPLDIESGPVGMTQPGVTQQVTLRYMGEPADCTPNSTVSVAVAVTQEK
jgi:hypothetical protein